MSSSQERYECTSIVSRRETHPVLNENRLGAAFLYTSAMEGAVIGSVAWTGMGFPAFLFLIGLRFAVACVFKIGELIPFPFSETAEGRGGSEKLRSDRCCC